MDTEVSNNENTSRFETNVDGFLATLEYELSGKTLILKHTEVPNPLEGRGLGGRIVKFALEYAQAHGLKVSPKCPFANSYIDRHQEYARLVSK